jgi:hypothetical protein
MIHDDFTALAVIVGVAAAAGIVANRLRQPLIVAFIAVGILAGPSGLGWVEGGDDLELFLIAILGLVTIGISTYMILNSQQLFDRLAPLLRHFERRDHKPDVTRGAERFDAIVYWLGRYGTHVVAALRRARTIPSISRRQRSSTPSSTTTTADKSS